MGPDEPTAASLRGATTPASMRAITSNAETGSTVSGGSGASCSVSIWAEPPPIGTFGGLKTSL
jgi:hypothetical protein